MIKHAELISALESIAGERAVDEHAGFTSDDLKSALPAATFSAFDFDSALLFGERVIFARPAAEMKPSVLAAQLRKVAQACGCEVACVLGEPTPT